MLPRVFDIHGRLVESLLEGEDHRAGMHGPTRTPSIAPGLYLCRLEATGLSDTQRTIVLR